ncbi:MAG: tryptophan transporter [Bacillota bacterium]
MNSDNQEKNTDIQDIQAGGAVLTGQQTKTRQIAIVAVLIAIGAVLRIVSPSIAGITPNWVIAMYCLAIILARPNLVGALGIGFAAGAICMVTSKSPVPYINLISEPVGAVAALALVLAIPRLSIKNYLLNPFIITFLATLASGITFITVNMLALSLPMEVTKVVFVTVVLPVATFNAVITQLLYAPAKKFLSM